MLLEHAFRRHIAMKRPFCRPGLLWEYTITVSCHCLMPSPFMQDIQGGRPASGQRRMREGRLARGQRRIRESACKRSAPDKGKRLTRGQRRMREDAWRGSRADREGVPDWRLTRREQGKSDWRTTLFNWRHPPFASALAFLLRSPFRSQLRQALHRARNR